MKKPAPARRRRSVECPAPSAKRPAKDKSPEPADQLWPIGRLVPYAKNARKLSDQAVNKVATSIKSFGFRQRIVVDGKGVILAGHTRWKAAQQLGLAEVPVHIAADLTPTLAKAYRLADNRTADESSFDFELLGPELLELQALDLDLALTGFDADELEKYMDSVGMTEESEAAKRASLVERFGVPPFSVLDARQGYWQDRKRAWLSLGIESELGRGEQLIPNGGGMSSKDRYQGGQVRAEAPGQPVTTATANAATARAAHCAPDVSAQETPHRRAKQNATR